MKDQQLFAGDADNLTAGGGVSASLLVQVLNEIPAWNPGAVQVPRQHIRGAAQPFRRFCLRKWPVSWFSRIFRSQQTAQRP
ncbi:hypothetical protein ACWC0C_08240 [Streptomyces sp. NPDC001709]